MTTKLNPKELLNAVKDLETQRPVKGLFKIVLASVLLVASSYFALSVPENISFFIAALFSGVIYAYALIPTHDAIHYTLTGIKWLDELYARIISYPIFWTHGTYAELHKLHHKMNGVEGRDPERKNPTSTEYFHKNLILRFYYRNRFLIDTFIFSGAGLIYCNIRDGLKFGKFSRSVKRALILDLSLLLMTHAGIIYMLLPYNAVLKFYLLFFIWERTAGAILHFRAHIEHDSLEPKGSNYYEVQLSSCRNIETWDIVSRYYNRLTYHSVHHAFPKIPFYNLKQAHIRLKEILKNTEVKIVENQGYIDAAKFIVANKCYFQISEKDKITKTEWVL